MMLIICGVDIMKLREVQLEILNQINADSALKREFDNYKFDDIYIWLNQNYNKDDSGHACVGEFTKLLLNLGVEPLLYVSKIYNHMYFRTDISHVDIFAHITEIDECAFMGCKYLTSVTFTEPSNLQIINEFAFDDCKSLKHIVIPKSVNYIGESAFYGSCEIGYAGTTRQFKRIILGNYWHGWRGKNDSVSFIHCTDGDVLVKDVK